MKVAVITPVYNDLERIQNAVRCVQSQTHGDIVHYIYDDASTDGTSQWLETVRGDPKIRVYGAHANHGQSHARNTLLDAALNTGYDYIAFLDSDDTWHPEHIAQSIEQLANAGASLVYHRPDFVFPDGSPAFAHNIPEPAIFIAKQLLANNYIWISTVVVQSECLKTERFDSELNSIEDWDMWIRLSQKYKFVRSPQKTATYLVGRSSQAQHGRTKLPVIAKKHTILSQCKLNLGCGADYLPDYINVDLYADDRSAKIDARFDAAYIPYPDNSVDEIRAMHLIEHFDWFTGNQILREWHRALKPGGKLVLETPDLLATAQEFAKQPGNYALHDHMFSTPWIPGQCHKYLFTEEQLRVQLGWAGFTEVTRITPQSTYIPLYSGWGLTHCFMCLEATKTRETVQKTLDIDPLKATDSYTYNEIFEQNSYKVSRCEVESRCIIDLGANLGFFSLFCWTLGASRIISVEAQKTVYEHGLLVFTAGNTEITPVHRAIWNADNETLFIPNAHVCSQISTDQGEPVQTITLKTLLDEYGVGGSDLVLKIDTEGSEFPVLLDTPAETLWRFAVIYCELHSNYHDNPLWRDPEIIRLRLNALGYRLVHSEPREFGGKMLYTEKWIRTGQGL
jgi:FkbM family methyltransferase